MSDFRSRPKGDFISTNDLGELYVLAEHWKSDLLFYKDDLTFLRKLIDRYFVFVSNDGDKHQVQKIGNEIIADEKECAALLQRTQDRMTRLARLIDGSLELDHGEFRTEQEVLEDDIAEFVKRVRENRRQVFAITEYVVERDKLTYLLDE